MTVMEEMEEVLKVTRLESEILRLSGLISELGARIEILEEARKLGVTSVDLPLIVVPASEAARSRRAGEA